MYAELHAHSAFSFLDGASLPDELATAAAELGYDAFALTDHNGCQRLDGVRAGGQGARRARRSTGRRSTSRTAATSRCWSRRRRAGATSARILTRAHAHARDHGEPPPAVPLETLEEHAGGLVCLSGCARHGVHDEPTLRRLLAAFGRDGLRVELQRPFQRDDRARNRRWPGWPSGSASPRWRRATSTRTRSRGRRCRTRSCALRNHTTLDASEPLRRGNTVARARLARGDGRALRGPPARGRRGRRAGRPAALRPHRRPRLPLSRLGGRRRGPHARRAVLGADGRALPARQPAPRRGARAAGGGAAGDRRARPARLLHPPPRPARARARRRGRGPRARLGARAAAAGARARVVGVLDRLLPHRPLAHRPGRERPLPRPLPQRGADRAAGHRPRLPARHPRGADPAHPRPLRARALGAGRRVPDVPLARGDPRAGQGARPAAGRARAGRARGRAVGGARRHRRRRVGARAGGRRAAGAAGRPRLARAVRDVDRRVAGDGQRAPARPHRGAPRRRGRGALRCPAAGRGWRGCATRPTGCRATSPSTRAG